MNYIRPHIYNWFETCSTFHISLSLSLYINIYMCIYLLFSQKAKENCSCNMVVCIFIYISIYLYIFLLLSMRYHAQACSMAKLCKSMFVPALVSNDPKGIKSHPETNMFRILVHNIIFYLLRGSFGSRWLPRGIIFMI